MNYRLAPYARASRSWKMADGVRARLGESTPCPVCELCGELQNLRVCGACRDTWYCSKEHQKSDWKHHKKLCRIAKASVNGANPVAGCRAVTTATVANPGDGHDASGLSGAVIYDGLGGVVTTECTLSPHSDPLDMPLPPCTQSAGPVTLSALDMGQAVPNASCADMPLPQSRTDISHDSHTSFDLPSPTDFASSFTLKTCALCPAGEAGLNCSCNTSAHLDYVESSIGIGFPGFPQDLPPNNASPSDVSYAGVSLSADTEPIVADNSLSLLEQNQLLSFGENLESAMMKTQQLSSSQITNTPPKVNNDQPVASGKSPGISPSNKGVPSTKIGKGKRRRQLASYQEQQDQKKTDADKKEETRLVDYVVRCLNEYGMCVVDHFLGAEKGQEILNEIKDLETCGAFRDGQTVNKTESRPTTKIRGDKIAWVEAGDEGEPNISGLIRRLDNLVISCSSKICPNLIHGRTKAMVACYPGDGTGYKRHIDNPNGDGRYITCIYYLNKNWDVETHGGLLRIFPLRFSRVADIEPMFDRLLFFWSDRRNPHEVQPAYRTRYAITVWYFDHEERSSARVRHQTQESKENAKKSTSSRQPSVGSGAQRHEPGPPPSSSSAASAAAAATASASSSPASDRQS